MLHKLWCLYRYTQHFTVFFLLLGFLWSDFVSRFSFTLIITATAGLALLVLFRVRSLSVCHCCVSVGTSKPCGVSLWTHYLSTHFNEVRRYHREHQLFLSKDVSDSCKCLSHSVCFVATSLHCPCFSKMNFKIWFSGCGSHKCMGLVWKQFPLSYVALDTRAAALRSWTSIDTSCKNWWIQLCLNAGKIVKIFVVIAASTCIIALHVDTAFRV